MRWVQQKERDEMELNDQFYDDGIDLSDTEFDKAEDGNLKEISMPDFVNDLLSRQFPAMFRLK